MIEITFEEVFTLNNLLKAHKKGRLSKRKKKPIVRFELQMFENLQKLYSELKFNTYQISQYNNFVIYEPKRREIQTLLYQDRIVQHVICDNVFMPYFSKRAIMDNCVCQQYKGMHFALDRFENKLMKFLKTHKTGYVLKCDIKKYFPSLSHEYLRKIFVKEIADFRLRQMLTMIIDSFHTNPKFLEKYGILSLGSGFKTERGVPIGNQTSQVFGMFYLNELDRFIKEKLRVKIYSRYMDDFVLVHESKKFLIEALKKITRITGKLKLSLNEKTKIFPLSNGLTYLGFRFIVKDGKIIKKVGRKTVNRFKARARLLNFAYAHGIIDKERVKASLTAYHGHLMHGNCYRLEKQLLTRIKVKEIDKQRHDGTYEKEKAKEEKQKAQKIALKKAKLKLLKKIKAKLEENKEKI